MADRPLTARNLCVPKNAPVGSLAPRDEKINLCGLSVLRGKYPFAVKISLDTKHPALYNLYPTLRK